MRPIISSAPPADRRPARTATGRRVPAEPAHTPRRRRSYVVYGSEVASDAMPGFAPADTGERSRAPVRREPFIVRLRSFLERNEFYTMWNPSFRGSDLTLVLIVGILLALGLVMVYSAGIGENTLENGLTLDFWFSRQARSAVLGVGALIFFWKVRYTFWKRWSVHLVVITAGLLAFVSLLGVARLGIARSVTAGGSGQPAELAKLIIVLYMANWLSSKGGKLRKFSLGFLPFTVMIGAFSALIAGQKVSTAVLLAITAMTMFFLAGADLKQIGVLTVLSGGAFAGVTSAVEYVRDRLTTFLAALRDPTQVTLPQIVHFMQSLQAGGLLGKGLGKGTIKGVLVLAHSDSIFAVIGEELGLLGCLIVVGLFAWLAYRGMCIALRRSDGYGQLLAFGVTIWLVTQAAIHIGVVTITIPTTGIPLPFISFGGTALVTAMAGVGLLLSISCSAASGAKEEDVSADSDVRGRDRRPRVSRSGSR